MISTSDHQSETITIESGSGHIKHKVIVTAATTISYKGKPSDLAEVKISRKLDCIGAFHEQEFDARSCSVE